MTKSGFIAVVGRPNSGKSTLLNYLIGEKLAMVSKKAQATRKRMNIIVMYKGHQLIFVDTPGIHKRERLINEFMLEEALRAMGDSDLILFLSPVTDSLSEYGRFLELKESKKIPHIVVLTKVDFVSNEELLKKLNEFQKYQDRFKAIIPFSVKKGVGKEALLDEVVKYLPESPPLFDTEIMTTENIRDIYKELIRKHFESLVRVPLGVLFPLGGLGCRCRFCILFGEGPSTRGGCFWNRGGGTGLACRSFLLFAFLSPVFWDSLL